MGRWIFLSAPLISICLESISPALLAKQDDRAVDLQRSPVSEPAPLKSLLKKVQSYEYPVEVNTPEEIQKISEAYSSLGPIRQNEAIALAKEIGSQYAEARARMRNVPAGTALFSKYKDEARQCFRNLIAVALRYECLSDRFDSWLKLNSRAWFFMSEVIVITAAVIGPDLAARDQVGAFHSIIEAYAVAFSTIASIWVPARIFTRFSRQDKLRRIITAFHSTAFTRRLFSPLRTRSGYQAALSLIQTTARELNYPPNFVSCALSLQKMGAQTEESKR